MSAQIIDGKAVAAALRARVKEGCAQLAAARGVTPGLAVILVGEDPASQIYVRNKERACAQVGIASRVICLPADTTAAALLAQVAALNADAAVHGILVQLPLPPQIDARQVLEAIDPAKDVDGFHPQNAGRLLSGAPGLVPCTPAGILALIDAAGVAVAGRECVVIGRSNIVGKPTALLLLARDGTVTICHSRTQNLAAVAARADILVAAVGKAGFVTAQMVKPGALVIDVGMNRDAAGRLCGDVDYGPVAQKAGFITPVPGGVGPMTIAMLLQNTLRAAGGGAD